MDYFSFLQWPAMVVTILSVWLLTFPSKPARHGGFFLSLIGNMLWIIWGWHAEAFGLLSLQFALAGLNVRGISKTE
ncbi:hypothetical protein SAMN05216387_102329 [Nitrosovibrio tenuis]|uniref:Inner membrane protein n=1 Tax=Nitrosovibrio tenuis TaxID=1233 RepID=A0A1H7IZK4_9PROT|nr:hypothetical protein SAMN05216387_102329 [Nitrosovibrio tenuis]